MLTMFQPGVRHHRGRRRSARRSEACSGTEDHGRPAKPTALWIHHTSCAHVLCDLNELYLTFRKLSHVRGHLDPVDETGCLHSACVSGLWDSYSTLEKSGNSLRRINHWHASESNWFLGDMKQVVDTRLDVIVSHSYCRGGP